MNEGANEGRKEGGKGDTWLCVEDKFAEVGGSKRPTVADGGTVLRPVFCWL